MPDYDDWILDEFDDPRIGEEDDPEFDQFDFEIAHAHEQAAIEDARRATEHALNHRPFQRGIYDMRPADPPQDNLLGRWVIGLDPVTLREGDVIRPPQWHTLDPGDINNGTARDFQTPSQFSNWSDYFLSAATSVLASLHTEPEPEPEPPAGLIPYKYES